MKVLLGVLLLLFPFVPAQAQNTAVPLQNFNKVTLSSVYDGDTFKVYLSCRYPIFCKAIPVRVRGVDCPKMRGGTEETKSAAKAPNPKGSVLSLQAVEAYGAEDRPLWKNSFTDKEEEKLSQAKEKLQKLEQAGNDWYAVYGTEIREDFSDYPSWITAN